MYGKIGFDTACVLEDDLEIDERIEVVNAIADHVKTTGHNIKWDHFDILASGKTDLHCKIKETLFIHEIKPSLNVNVSSEKLMLY